jgi:hypothetical protein
MSTILLCYYCIGWVFVAQTCRDFYAEDLSLLMLLGLLFLWPVVLLLILLDRFLCMLADILVWRRE